MSFFGIALIVWTALAYLPEIISFIATYKIHKILKNQVQRQNQKPKFSKKVSVIVPCKGLDNGLEENIKSFLNQNYRNYETIFVVDDFRDPCVKILKRFSKNKRAKIIKTKKDRFYHGKPAALATGIKHASCEILAFADSDIRPHPNWLCDMISPLLDRSATATTSFRWYFPENGNLSSCIRSAWNTIGLGIMFSDRMRYVWGGSWAIRKKDFHEINFFEKWKNQFSEDSQVTIELKRLRKKVKFVPEALAATFDSSTFFHLFEFTNRQIAIVRKFSKKAYRTAFFLYTWFTLIFISGIFVLLYSYFFSKNLYLFGILLILPQFLTVMRSWIRYNCIQKIVPEYSEHFKKFKARIILSDFFVRFLQEYNLIRAKFMKKIVWRGNEISL